MRLSLYSPSVVVFLSSLNQHGLVHSSYFKVFFFTVVSSVQQICFQGQSRKVALLFSERGLGNTILLFVSELLYLLKYNNSMQILT